MFKKYLDKLQNSDEKTKKKWFLVLTTMAIIIVCLVWVQYLAVITRPAATVTDNSNTEDTFSFLETMKSGARIITGKIYNSVAGIMGAVKSPKEYEVKPN